MLARIRSIIGKEFIQIVRDPRTLALILVMPIMQLLIFGYAIVLTPDRIPLVVSDEARTPDSRGLVQALVNTTNFTLVGHVDGLPRARAAIDGGQAKAALIIPPEFGRQVLAGRPAGVQMLIDGSDPSVANTALATAGQVAQARGAALAAERAERMGRGAPTSGAIELRPTVLYNPSMESVNFMVPALIGLILQFQAVLLTAFAVVRERERGTLEQLIVTPIRAWELLLGKILPFVAIAFIQIGIALAVGLLWFRVPLNGSLGLLLALSLLFLISALGIGLFISTVSATQGQAMQSSLFVLLPSFLLSGFMSPREAMPVPLQWLSSLIPLTYYIQILRGIVLKGNGVAELWWPIAALAVFGVVIFALSAARFQKRLA
jgi:ABC-2 type transport system permease protein